MKKIIWHKKKSTIPEASTYDEREGCSVSIKVVNNRGEPFDTSFDLVEYVEEVHSLVCE